MWTFFKTFLAATILRSFTSIAISLLIALVALPVVVWMVLGTFSDDCELPNYKLPDKALNKENLCERADAWDESTKCNVGYAYYCGREVMKDYKIAKCLLSKVDDSHKVSAILHDIFVDQQLGTENPYTTQKKYCSEKESQQTKEK